MKFAATYPEPRNRKILISLMIFFGALALHAALLFLFRPVTRVETPAAEQKRFTIMMQGAPSHEFRYWLNYQDPAAFIVSDDQTGFASYRKVQELKRIIPMPLYAVNRNINAVLPEIPLPKRLPPRSSGDFLSPMELPLNPVTSEQPPAVRSSDPVKYPRWMTGKGAVLEVDPLLTGVERTRIRILTERQLPDATILTLSPNLLNQDLPPEVRVSQSCGNAELDSIAMRRMYSLNPDQQKRIRTVVVYWTQPAWTRPQEPSAVQNKEPNS